IQGAKFSPATTFQLEGPGDVVIPASRDAVESSALAYATFNLAFQPTGLYTLRAVDGEASTTLANAVNVVDGQGADILTDITDQNDLRPNRAYTFEFVYANGGDTDTMAPLFLVESRTGTPISLSPAGLAEGKTLLQVLGLVSDGPATTFRPG